MLKSRSENRVGGAMVFIGPDDWVFEFGYHPARLHVRVGECLVVGEYGAARHAGRVESSIQALVGKVVVIASISLSSSSRWSMRLGRSMNRGSSAQSGRLRTSLIEPGPQPLGVRADRDEPI